MKRMRRSSYWAFLLAANIVIAGLYYAATNGTFQFDASNASYVGVVGLSALVLGVVAIAMSVRRLHDVGATGWWAVFILVPVANLITILLLLFWPGTKGPNEFGRDPRKRPTKALESENVEA